MSHSSEKSHRGINWSHSMALNHLPPKSPSVSSSALAPPYPGCVRVPNYSGGGSGHHPVNHHHPPHHHRRSPSASHVPDVEPSWLEDLLDSPKAPERRLVSHRRSASDSIAFLEAPSNLRRIDDIAEEDEIDSLTSFDREEALASMFSEMSPFHGDGGGWSEINPRGAIHRPYHGVPKVRLLNDAPPHQLYHEGSEVDAGGDPNADPKRSKRQSAQRSRVRKLQYIHELEGNVNDLQNEVSALATQIALLEHQRLALHFDNAALKQSVSALAQEKVMKDAHAEALEKEVYRLRRVEKQQQQQRLRQQLALANYSVETTSSTTTTTRHMRRASAGSVQELGSASASEVLDSFIKLVEKSDASPPVLRSSCTPLSGAGKSLQVGGRSASIPPGFILQNQ